MTSNFVTNILTQYHVSKDLKVFGDKDVKAVLKQLKQLHDRMVIELTDAQELTIGEKRAIFEVKTKTMQKHQRKGVHQWAQSKTVHEQR